MKHSITQILNRHIVADETMVKIVQIMMYVAGGAVLSLSLWKLSRLDLTESQLFFGVLLVPVLPFLFIVLGILMPLAIAPKNAR